MILINPRLIHKKLYLHCTPENPQKCSNKSRRQEITINVKDNINSVWSFEFWDPKIRFEMNGQPI